MLPHEVICCVYRVTAYHCITRRRKHRIGHVRQQREGAVLRTEVIVNQRRRHGVEVIRVDVVEAVVAVGVGNYFRRPGSAQIQGYTSQRASVVGGDPAADAGRSRRRRVRIERYDKRRNRTGSRADGLRREATADGAINEPGFTVQYPQTREGCEVGGCRHRDAGRYRSRKG